MPTFKTCFTLLRCEKGCMITGTLIKKDSIGVQLQVCVCVCIYVPVCVCFVDIDKCTGEAMR